MHAFEYHRPSSTKDALALGQKEEARYLAGGQSLVQAMKLRLSSPSDLIDLSALKELSGIKVSGSNVEIGAMTRHADVAGSNDVQKAIPALAALAGIIGDRQVRHMGTLGGSLANSDPAADYPAAVLGLGATITTNKRKIEADRFFKSLYETALEPGELITSVAFPAPKRAAYMKFKNPASRFAIVGVFVADFGGGKVRVAVTGAGPCAFRQADMEKALAAKFAPESVANIKVKPDGLNNDLHASPEYRAHLITVMAKRAVEAALK
ncbi:MAG TPA: xanthine dehydrogenase family protein subunit M [Burkholderiales bacterium]|nr:xanthine dehydrogenase family protein subunit M [Burkholderiales bacterium]HET9351667.1 xanthine dehydrogenase family protein subunit M [Burkholderiales bacterium]